MVDNILPDTKQERRLRYLFLDLNAYFASVEQQENPDLRGKPVAVVPVMADTSFIIAASYEAKAYGIKTGTQIGEAKRRCSELVLVKACPPAYVAYHNRVIDACSQLLPVEKVCSIDEMRFRLLGDEREPVRAVELAREMKQIIHDQVGQYMNCSIGIAPNHFLAKLATEIQKPDGLVVLQMDDLPHRLHALQLTDFTGINRRTAARLNAAGIFTAEQLCKAERHELRAAFSSIIGERWWYLLRGYELELEESDRKTLGHSHVLPPNLRTDKGCREVLLRLIQKASARLRSENLWTSGMVVSVSAFEKSWHQHVRLPPTQDTITINEYFLDSWKARDFSKPRGVGVCFTELREAEQVTPSLFEQTYERAKLNRAVDQVNQKFGKNSVYLAGMEHAKYTAPERIAFNKTWLFSEGKGDNEWVDTFRGNQRKN